MLLATLYSVSFASIHSFTPKSPHDVVAMRCDSSFYRREIEVTCQEEQPISSLQVTRKSLNATCGNSWNFGSQLLYIRIFQVLLKKMGMLSFVSSNQRVHQAPPEFFLCQPGNSVRAFSQGNPTEQLIPHLHPRLRFSVLH